VPTVKDLANAYLASQEQKAQHGLITARWFEDCIKTLKPFVEAVGKDRRWDDLRPEDFAGYRLRLYERYGVCAVDRAITVIRAMFKHAYEMGLIDKPVTYGGQFNKPTAKEKRQNRLQRDRLNGKRLFTPAEVRRLIEHADLPLRAMILLGINGGLGNTDCAELPIAALDLEAGLLEYERTKTAIPRVVPLWPETVAALREVIAQRPKPRRPEYAHLVFLTTRGNPWKKEQFHVDEDEASASPRVARQEAIGAQFSKLLRRLGLKRPGLGFYALRHTFRTWADEAKDQHAVLRIMGHAIPGMSGVYVEQISLDRLRAVADLVRGKLLEEAVGPAVSQ